ncbi:MAG: LytR C-terminal domain-containing protein [Acidimicrobiales bacterium]
MSLDDGETREGGHRSRRGSGLRVGLVGAEIVLGVVVLSHSMSGPTRSEALTKGTKVSKITVGSRPHRNKGHRSSTATTASATTTAPTTTLAPTTTTTTTAPVTTTTTSSPATTSSVFATITVRVANGTTITGLAGRLTNFIGALGFNVVAPVNAVRPVSSSVVYYAPGFSVAAGAVAARLSLPSSAVQPDPANLDVAAPPEDINVIAGPNLAGVG